MSKQTIVITRHAALAEYLTEIGVIAPGARVLAHATEDDVRKRIVVGVLPLHLAALANAVVHVPLDIPAELRGAELTVEQVRAFARPVEVYVVKQIALPGLADGEDADGEVAS